MDDLERRIRASRPISGHRNLPLSDRAKRELAELVLVDAPEAEQRHRILRPSFRRPLIWVAAAIVAILTIVSSAAVFQPVRVWAATPPLLTATPVAGTAAELLNQMADAAAASGDPAPTGDIHIEMQEWVLNMEYDDRTGGSASTTVMPENFVFDRYTNGSYTSVSTAGVARDYAASAAPWADIPAEGTVLSRVEYGPGEYEPLFPSPFPAKAEQVGPYFEQLFDPGTLLDADAAFQNIPLVLMEQVFGAAQRAAALRYLAALPGIDVVGAVTDRLGRAGIMFRAARAGDPDYLNYLVIAPGNGRILAAETHYVGHDRTDIRSPSVTSYYAWK